MHRPAGRRCWEHSGSKRESVVRGIEITDPAVSESPPHTTQKLQPLDRVVMKHFRNSYNEAYSLWMRKYPKLKIDLKDIPGMVNSAFTRVSRMELSQSALACTGIYPMNRKIFFIWIFKPFSQEICSAESTEDNPSSPAQLEVLTSVPSTSQALLEELSPLPNSSNVNFTARRRRGAQSEILTSTPYKAQLEEKKVIKHVLKFNENKGQVNCIICGEHFDEDWIECNVFNLGRKKTVPQRRFGEVDNGSTAVDAPSEEVDDTPVASIISGVHEDIADARRRAAPDTDDETTDMDVSYSRPRTSGIYRALHFNMLRV
ncbi:hypothetical protein PR048_001730 [Dryococelus australis]|uniref:Uncharacterized protein n=1 Tax=Dryococelus australis TaxID=614101 RepID=A0ABQ9IIB2_9NEOP|nr:hypothetical protein PR048_001730 [Dryococelus australis]